MLLIPVTDLRPGTVFQEADGLFQVLEYNHRKIARGGATVIVKARNLKNGTILRKTFQSGGKVENVQLDHVQAAYLYRQGDMLVFMDNGTYEQFEVPKRRLGDYDRFLKEGLEVVVSLHEGKVLKIEFPLKVDFAVVEAPPDFRGDTSQGGTKEVTLENGLKVKVPMFIKKGDKVRIDTRNGSYVERV